MSNDTAIVRVFKLWAKISMMIVDGRRDAAEVADTLQTIVNTSTLWREKDGVIYFSVTSDGTTGPEWINRLESNGFAISQGARDVLCSSDFKPTSGVTTEVAVLKGTLFEDGDRITTKIRAEADKRKLSKSNAELACLIREKFTDEEIEAMGLIRIVAIHEPINNSYGSSSLLHATRDHIGRWLDSSYYGPDSRWGRAHGFAFAVSQVSSKP